MQRRSRVVLRQLRRRTAPTGFPFLPRSSAWLTFTGGPQSSCLPSAHYTAVRESSSARFTRPSASSDSHATSNPASFSRSPGYTRGGQYQQPTIGFFVRELQDARGEYRAQPTEANRLGLLQRVLSIPLTQLASLDGQAVVLCLQTLALLRAPPTTKMVADAASWLVANGRALSVAAVVPALQSLSQLQYPGLDRVILAQPPLMTGNDGTSSKPQKTVMTSRSTAMEQLPETQRCTLLTICLRAIATATMNSAREELLPLLRTLCIAVDEGCDGLPLTDVAQLAMAMAPVDAVATAPLRVSGQRTEDDAKERCLARIRDAPWFSVLRGHCWTIIAMSDLAALPLLDLLAMARSLPLSKDTLPVAAAPLRDSLFTRVKEEVNRVAEATAASKPSSPSAAPFPVPAAQFEAMVYASYTPQWSVEQAGALQTAVSSLMGPFLTSEEASIEVASRVLDHLMQYGSRCEETRAPVGGKPSSSSPSSDEGQSGATAATVSDVAPPALVAYLQRKLEDVHSTRPDPEWVGIVLRHFYTDLSLRSSAEALADRYFAFLESRHRGSWPQLLSPHLQTNTTGDESGNQRVPSRPSTASAGGPQHGVPPPPSAASADSAAALRRDSTAPLAPHDIVPLFVEGLVDRFRDPLTTLVQTQLDRWNVTQVLSFLRTIATVPGKPTRSILREAAVVLVKYAERASGEQLASLMESYGTAGVRNDAFCEAVTNRVRTLGKELSLPEMTAILAGLASVEYRSTRAFIDLAPSIVAHLDAFAASPDATEPAGVTGDITSSSSTSAATACAYATAASEADSLTRLLAAYAKMMVWQFKVFWALAERLTQLKEELSLQQLVVAQLAVIRMDLQHPGISDALAERVRAVLAVAPLPSEAADSASSPPHGTPSSTPALPLLDSIVLLSVLSRSPIRDEAIYTALATHISTQQRADEARGQPPLDAEEIAELLLSLARAGMTTQGGLFDELALRAVGLVPTASPLAMAHLVTALALAGRPDPELFSLVADRAVSMKEHIPAVTIATILAAFATADVHNDKLFIEMIPRVKHVTQYGTPRDVTNVVYAYSKVGVWHYKLFARLADYAVQLRGEFRCGDIARLLSAYAAVGMRYDRLFVEFSPRVQTVSHLLRPSEVVDIVRSYVSVGVEDVPVFRACADRAEQTASNYTESEAQQLLASFAIAGFRHTGVLRALSARYPALETSYEDVREVTGDDAASATERTDDVEEEEDGEEALRDDSPSAYSEAVDGIEEEEED